MENIKAQIAFDLVPILRHLYDGGVIGIYVDGGRRRIHIIPDMFHEVFPDVAAPAPNPDSIFPWRWTTTVEGVEFFALGEEWAGA